MRKLAAIAALLALVLPVFSTLAGTISAADLRACCKTNYCPLHHNSRNNSQKDRPDCPGKNMPGPGSSAMRACDSAPNAIVGAPFFVLVTPIVLRALATNEAAYVLPSHSAASFVAIPRTPPPRTVQS